MLKEVLAAIFGLIALASATAGVAAAGLLWFVGRGEVSILTGAAIMFGLCAVVLTVALAPAGLMVARSMVRLKHDLEQIAQDNEQHPVMVGPKWLRPILDAFTEAVDRFRQRENAFRNQLRDLEIRHRVVDAERRQIEAVLHALRDGVIVTDSFNEITMVNETAAEILGFTVEQAMRKPIDDVLNNEYLSELVRSTREQANFADRRHVEYDLPIPGHNGEPEEERAFEITLTCVENHKHEVGGVVTILHDITREREVSQLKSEFVSKASHELRTPLSSIRAYVEMLVDGEATDEASRREFYSVIHNETDRLSRLIDNMLNISRIEAGIVQIEREHVDMKPLIQRAVETLEPQARDKAQMLNAKIAEVDLSVEGDADMLYQVVLNLISNAVKYTPENGRIIVAADSDNLTRSVVVTVTDTGLGIPPDAVSRLFEKFYRVENFKRVAKGTGLGLNLCKHIVETLHQGQIGVDSKLGMGSKFWFSIPMRYAGSQSAA